MGNFTVDKKLELMRQIRSRYQQNRYDMFHRERLLYGKSAAFPEKAYPEDPYPEDAEDAETYHTFSLRILLALGLFLLIIICDLSGRSFFGIQASQCFSAISADYENSIDAWVDAVSADTLSGAGHTDENPPAGSRP